MESPRAMVQLYNDPADANGGSAEHDLQNLIPSPRVQGALEILLQAHHYASDLAGEVWDFAVEISTLRDLGLTNNDFRWLVGKGLVAHAHEVTKQGDSKRSFKHPKILEYCETTAFTLSNAGIEFAQRLRQYSEESTRSVNGGVVDLVSNDGSESYRAIVNGSPPVGPPKWDRERQQLRIKKWIIKQFKVPAPNQEAILAAFEEEGWPPRIDDPLSPIANQQPKRRLHDTINSLNRNQKISLIRFQGDGSGQGVRWEFTDQLVASLRRQA